MNSRLHLFAFVLLLAGCDNIATLLADPRVAQREADAKAIGGACRFGLRSIEDCYALNEKASKSAIFTGWKDMDQYMRDNKVEGIPAKIEKPLTPPPPMEEIIEEPQSKSAVKPKAQTGSKAASGH
ncbi:MAG: hypothetical protein A3F78_07570 [Burkholderiales bacterium RIFCSPLOWO2_12_FULL_61_40]|nr:MAG: hypothetical protein A3F78_07570 [Burkholderiales bacterium RIFCSPLOWO2_12_FULL_61_40]